VRNDAVCSSIVSPVVSVIDSFVSFSMSAASTGDAFSSPDT
jgi:hypothetical protein